MWEEEKREEKKKEEISYFLLNYTFNNIVVG